MSMVSGTDIFIALHSSTETSTRNMTFSWFTIALLLYIISEIIAVPLRIASQEKKYFGLNEKLNLLGER